MEGRRGGGCGGWEGEEGVGLSAGGKGGKGGRSDGGGGVEWLCGMRYVFMPWG